MERTVEPANGLTGRRRTLARVAVSFLIVGTLGPVAASNAFAAFGRAATPEGGGPASGTVYLTSDAGSHAALSMPNGGPGSSTTSSTTIRYEGTLPAAVHLYASTSGTGLSRFLTLTVTRGTGEGTAFVPDSTDYAGAGPGVVFRGTLAAFPSGWASGVVDPGVWRPGESHSYRFVVTLADDGAAQGLRARASFHWEARAA